jgi:hypothetical protein
MFPLFRGNEFASANDGGSMFPLFRGNEFASANDGGSMFPLFMGLGATAFAGKTAPNGCFERSRFPLGNDGGSMFPLSRGNEFPLGNDGGSYLFIFFFILLDLKGVWVKNGALFQF